METQAAGAIAWAALDAGDAAQVVAMLSPAGTKLSLADTTLRGLAHYDLGDDTAAIDDLSAVLRHEPENPIARSHLALALARAGRRTEAADLLQGMPPFPHHGFLRRFLAQFWPVRIQRHSVESNESQPASAEAATEQTASRADQRRCEKLASQARKLFFRDRRREALALFDEAWKLDPHNGHVAENYAYLLLLLGEPRQAEVVLRPKLEALIEAMAHGNSDGVEGHGDLVTSYAWCRHEAGAHEEALKLLSVVRPEGPEDFGSHFVAAMCWLLLGREREYREALDQALGPYFIDTWEQIVKPMIIETAAVLRNPIVEVASVE